jgi:hypothetical protein
MDGTCLHCRNAAGAGGSGARPPEGLTFEAGKHVFQRRWYRTPTGLLVTGTTAVLIAWTALSRLGVIAMGAHLEPYLPYVLPFGIVLSAVALVNRTRISVSPERLELARGPIPVPLMTKNLVVPRDQIDTVEVRTSFVDNDYSNEAYSVRVWVNNKSDIHDLGDFSGKQKKHVEHMAWLMKKVLGVPVQGSESF